MNNYVKTFRLRSDDDYNDFIWDLGDIKKMRANLPVPPPFRKINYIKTYGLVNDKLKNKFIEDFVKEELMDEAVRIASRREFEDEVGLKDIREEDKWWRAEIEKKFLERMWDRKYGWKNGKPK